ncbi:MAG: ATP-binding response regulator [Candidatus Sumerlaeaceae bacterium]
MGSEPEKEFLQQDQQRRDRESLCHVEDLQGLAELAAFACSTWWAGIVAEPRSDSPLWVAFGPGASALGRSELLWKLGSNAKEMLSFTCRDHRGETPIPPSFGGAELGMLVIMPVLGSAEQCLAFLWVADRRARGLTQPELRALRLLTDEIKLRLELRERLHEKLEALQALEKLHQELRQTNRELAVARDRALEGERAKAIFLTNLGHELRTPLNAILGFTEILLEEARELERDSLTVPLEHVHEAAHRLAEMIENALYVARVDTKRMPLYLETFDLGRLLTETIETVRPLATKNGNEVSMTLPSNLGNIYADPGKVRQIVYNLLTNACKFTHKGKISLSASRVTEGSKECVRIVVADTGKGFTKAQMEKLLDELVPTEETPGSPLSGLGVGLAVANRFCKMMNGSIRVTSRVGHGSRFVVTLPTRVELPEQSPFPSSGTLRAVTSVLPEPPATAPLVLVIENDSTTRDLVCASLRRAGYRAIGAASGKEALEAIELEPPRAITLDVNLGDEDGWQLLAKLRALPATVNVPIILVTETVDQNLAFELGATDVVSKPVSPKGLGETLRRWVSDSPPRRGPGR